MSTKQKASAKGKAKKEEASVAAIRDEIEDMELDSDNDAGHVGNNEANQQKRPKLTVKREEGDNCNATYSFLNEDHTLGNLLRNIIIKSNQVEFCAYSVPHPSEPVMNVRLQVSQSCGDTKKVLRSGLTRIAMMSDVLTEKFNNALTNYE